MKPANPKTLPIKLSFSINIVSSPPPSIKHLGIDDAAKRLADVHLALARRRERGKLTTAISQAVDNAVSSKSDVESAANDIGKLNGERAIGVMINIFDTLVKVGDEIAAVRTRPIPPLLHTISRFRTGTPYC